MVANNKGTRRTCPSNKVDPPSCALAPSEHRSFYSTRPFTIILSPLCDQFFIINLTLHLVQISTPPHFFFFFDSPWSGLQEQPGRLQSSSRFKGINYGRHVPTYLSTHIPIYEMSSVAVPFHVGEQVEEAAENRALSIWMVRLCTYLSIHPPLLMCHHQHRVLGVCIVYNIWCFKNILFCC